MSPAELAAYASKRRSHWDAVARRWQGRRRAGAYYHRRLAEIFRTHVPPGQRVLEVGCGAGDLLAALEPSAGVGVDLSSEAIRLARTRHPHLRFVEADAHALDLHETFDVIILSDLVNDLWDVQQVLMCVNRLCHPATRVILNFYSRLWEQPLALAQRFGWATPLLAQNWLTVEDVADLLHLADFEPIAQTAEVLWPFGTPLLADAANTFLVRFWPFRAFALTHVVVARPRPAPPSGSEPIVSVVVPARNEAGNIERIFAEMPEMGAGTEIVFVEGHSRDETFETIERAIALHPERRCLLMRQPGEGKGDAVRIGFQRATGDVLMILDADLTVDPQDLPRFYDALRTGKAEFVNGVRLVYPMEGQAMRFLNLIANKCFGLAFSWLLGQPIKDTLCGTKVLTRTNYERIAANRGSFGDFDPYGDFDLIFGAAKLDLRIVDLPVRYRARTYGTTNIRRWSQGWLLLKMMMVAARRLKFI